MADTGRKRKNAFTIVELAIVMAIVSVIASVAIVAFSNILDKSNNSAYCSLARNLNTLLSVDENINGKPDNVTDAITVLIEGGYSIEYLTDCQDGYSLVYNINKNRIVLFSDNLTNVEYGNAEGELCVIGDNYYTGSNFYNITAVCAYSYESVVNISYTDIPAVYLYTCANNCTITVNSPQSAVYHYGTAEVCEITAGKYYLAGSAGSVYLKSSSICLAAGSVTGNIYLEGDDNYIEYETGATLGNIVYGDCTCFSFCCSGGETVTVNTAVTASSSVLEQNGITLCRTLDEPVAHTHTYGEWVTITKATCTENGLMRRYCTGCDEYEEQKIDSNGHDYTATVHSPTCTEKGYTEYVCSACGDCYTGDYTDATGHSYTATVHSPACTEKGYTEYVCSACGDCYMDNYTAATGHNETEEHICSESVNESGYYLYTCSACGETHTEEDGVYKYTKELKFVESTDNTYYTVKGFNEGTTETNIDVYIPAYYNGLPVTAIDDEAFEDTNITSVTMGNNITTIGNSAFSGCSSLTTINIPQSVTTIGVNAFYYCSMLTTVYYEAKRASDCNNTNTFACAGQNSGGLTFYVAKNVKYIPASLFACGTNKYANVTAIIFAEESECEEIGKTAFSIKYLKYVVLPTTLIINSYVFNGSNSAAVIYYCGTSDQWTEFINSENLKKYNSFITKESTVVYYYSDSQKTDSWYYDSDGLPMLY